MTSELEQLMSEVNRKFVAQRRAYENKIRDLNKRMQLVENDLAIKTSIADRLTKENEQLKKMISVDKLITKNVDDKVKMKNGVDIGCNTERWDDILETELKIRIEAFIELCQQTSNFVNNHEMTANSRDAVNNNSAVNPKSCDSKHQFTLPSNQIDESAKNLPVFSNASKLADSEVWHKVMNDTSNFETSTPYGKFNQSNVDFLEKSYPNDDTLLSLSKNNDSTLVKTPKNRTRLRIIDEMEKSLTNGYDELAAKANEFIAKRSLLLDSS